MGTLLKQLPGRQLELILAALLVLGLLVGIGLNRNNAAGTQWVMITLELLFPPVIGLVAAGLLANDPALDLLLSVPQPAPLTLARRTGVLLAYAAVLGLVIHGLSTIWMIPLPVKGVSQVLIWISPTCLYVGLAMVGALMRGRMLDGVGLVLTVWVVTLVTISLITDACARSASGTCLGAVASPAMSYFRSQDPLWLLNRSIWLVLGTMLIGVGIALTRYEERLVEAGRRQEE